MAKSKTPSYVLTLRLKTEIHQEHTLSKRFELSRNIYNACLGQLYKRYAALKQSKRYREVCKMEKGSSIKRKGSEGL